VVRLFPRAHHRRIGSRHDTVRTHLPFSRTLYDFSREILSRQGSQANVPVDNTVDHGVPRTRILAEFSQHYPIVATAAVDQHVLRQEADDENEHDHGDGGGIWQLSLTFRYQPTAENRAFYDMGKFCESHDDAAMAEIRHTIESSAAFSLADARADSIELYFEDVC
jgi:hypothetical protein